MPWMVVPCTNSWILPSPLAVRALASSTSTVPKKPRPLKTTGRVSTFAPMNHITTAATPTITAAADFALARANAKYAHPATPARTSETGYSITVFARFGNASDATEPPNAPPSA